MTRRPAIYAALLAILMLALPMKAQAGFGDLHAAFVPPPFARHHAAPALFIPPEAPRIHKAGMRRPLVLARRRMPRPLLRMRRAPRRIVPSRTIPRRIIPPRRTLPGRIMRPSANRNAPRVILPRPARPTPFIDDAAATPIRVAASPYNRPRRPFFRPRRVLPPVFRPPRRRPRASRPGPAPLPAPSLPRAAGGKRIPPSQALRNVLRISPGSMGLGVELLPGGHPVYAVKLKTGSRIRRILVDALSGKVLDR